jgi:hypothetical protein
MAPQAFCDQVRTSGNQQQALRLADDFEGQGALAQVAEFAAVGKQYERAARLYLQVRTKGFCYLTALLPIA